MPSKVPVDIGIATKLWDAIGVFIDGDLKSTRRSCEWMLDAIGRDQDAPVVALWSSACVGLLRKNGCLAHEKGAEFDRRLVTETAIACGQMYDWAIAGYPVFSLADDFFAALSVTDFSDPSEEPLKLPFKAFVLGIPPSRQFLGCTKLFVSVLSDKFIDLKNNVVAPSVVPKNIEIHTLQKGSITTSFPVGMSRRELSKYNPTQHLDEFSETLSSDETVALDAMPRLLANFLSYLDMAGGISGASNSNGSATDAIEKADSRRPVFRVGSPIKIDATMKAALLSGARDAGAWKNVHRFVVRGHWKEQPFGLLRLKRKRIWVEPYWKGPKDIQEALERVYEVAK